MTAAPSLAPGARAHVTTFTLALNYLPLVQLLAGATLVAWLAPSPGAGLAGFAAWVYLAAPLA